MTSPTPAVPATAVGPVRCADGLAQPPAGLPPGAGLVHAARAAAAQVLAALAGVTPDLLAVFVSPGAAAGALDAGVGGPGAGGAGAATAAGSAAAARGPADWTDWAAADVEADPSGAALLAAADVVGARHAVGCTATGVFAAGGAIENAPAVAVWAALLPGTRVQAFHLEVFRTGDGPAVVGMPPRAPDDAVAVLLADPFTFPTDGFVTRATAALPGLAVVGGVALGPTGAGSTRLLVDGVVHDRGAVGVLLGDRLVARTVLSQGCRPVGPPMTVTAAEGNVLLGLAGASAATKVRDVLANLPAEDRELAAAGVQLGVAINEYADDHDHGDFLVRAVLGTDVDRDGLVVSDFVDVGRTVQLQVRDAASADADLHALLTASVRALGPAAGGLLFSCVARGAGLFGDARHDSLLVRSVLAPQGAVAGFFAGGELGPVGGGSHLHTLSASVLALGGQQGAAGVVGPPPGRRSGPPDPGAAPGAAGGAGPPAGPVPDPGPRPGEGPAAGPWPGPDGPAAPPPNTPPGSPPGSPPGR